MAEAVFTEAAMQKRTRAVKIFISAPILQAPVLAVGKGGGWRKQAGHSSRGGCCPHFSYNLLEGVCLTYRTGSELRSSWPNPFIGPLGKLSPRKGVAMWPVKCRVKTKIQLTWFPAMHFWMSGQLCVLSLLSSCSYSPTLICGTRAFKNIYYSNR